MFNGSAWKFVLGGAAVLLIAGAVTAIQLPSMQISTVQAQSAGGGTSCISDPRGPEMVDHNQTYEHHWIREGVQLDFQVQCAGGQAPLNLWWEVNGDPAEPGMEYAFLSDQWGRGIYSVDAYCMDAAGYCDHQTFHVEVFDEDAFTIVFLPDTQYYTKPGRSVQYGGDGIGRPEMFYEQTAWAASARDTLGIGWVAHLGDVIEGSGAAQQCTPPQNATPPAECMPASCPSNPDAEAVDMCQWARGDMAMATLEKAGIPYSIAIGNHDYHGSSTNVSDRDLDIFDAYFPPARWANMVNSIDHYEAFGIFEDEELEPPVVDSVSNSYHLFTAGGRDFMLIAHEYQLRSVVREWLHEVIEAHPHRRIINTNHHSQSPQPELVVNNSQIFLNAWGHAGMSYGTLFSSNTRNNGSPWHNMYVNYQFQDNGGDGYLRLLVFEPGRDLITARTYSPYRDLEENHDENYPPIKPNLSVDPERWQNFDFTYSMNGPVPHITVQHGGGPPSSLKVLFNGTKSFSDEADVEIASYEWSLGDGGFATGEIVEHTYDDLGQYAIELTVIDNLGKQNIATMSPIPVPYVGHNWHGDANRNGYVDRYDLDYVIERFGTYSSVDVVYSSQDVVGTGKFDEYDVLSVLCNWGRVIGDVNRDCVVNTTDQLEVLAHWGGCPWPCMADIAKGSFPTHGPDGIVDVTDLNMVFFAWNSSGYPGCHEPPEVEDISSIPSNHIDPTWLTPEGQVDPDACMLLEHWFGNPAYE